jgi:hypothetical protein
MTHAPVKQRVFIIFAGLKFFRNRFLRHSGVDIQSRRQEFNLNVVETQLFPDFGQYFSSSKRKIAQDRTDRDTGGSFVS